MENNVVPVYVLHRLLPEVLLNNIRTFLRNPIVTLQRWWRWHFRYPVLTRSLYDRIVRTIPNDNRPFALVRTSSMGSPEWCCPYKNDFFSHFGKRYDRILLYRKLHALKRNVYGRYSRNPTATFEFRNATWRIQK